MHTIRVRRYGMPDVMAYEDMPKLSTPGLHEARVRVKAIGVNYVDVYQRTGFYPIPLPFTPGMEMAGVVDAVGPGVTSVRVGDRVAYAATQPGAYADVVVAPVDRLVGVPDDLDLPLAAAALFQGVTAHYLTHTTYPIQPDDRVLVHAAAGGTGLLLVQMAKRRGAWVVGTVSTKQKAAVAREAGADATILYTSVDNTSVEVRRLTGGAGVHVAYDGVGQATFRDSLAALRPRGHLVLYGAASGPVPPIDPNDLQAASLYLTRPSLAHHIATFDALAERATAVFDGIRVGALRPQIHRSFPLSAAAEAHTLLEGRATTGKLLLIP